MNGFTENECLPNLELKFKILENLSKPLTLKSTGRRIDIDAENCTNIRAKFFVILYENCSTNFNPCGIFESMTSYWNKEN